MLLGTVWPAVQADAAIGGASCSYSVTIHASSGVHAIPVATSSGAYTLFGTLACSGSVTGVTNLNGSGTYTSALSGGNFAGTWSTLSFVVGQSCSGDVSGLFEGTGAAGTVSNVSCVPDGNGSGTFAGNIQPDPLTVNTCGAPAGAGDAVYCDFFAQGTIEFSNA